MHAYKTFLSLFAIAVLLLSCASSGDTSDGNFRQLPSDAEVEQHNATAKAEDKIVCREETPVGTNIPKRLCRYVQDIKETSDFHRQQLRNVLR